MTPRTTVVDWLMDSDPALRWQVMRDLLGAPEDRWQAERAAVATTGWGARLFALEDEDGQWAGAAYAPEDVDEHEWRTVGQPWTATAFVLTELRQLGVAPDSEPAQRAVRLVGENARLWDDRDSYWAGEVEECINARVVADGTYFGVDVTALVARLLTERLEDGGWNCERANGSVRSSFDTTISVVEALLLLEQAGLGTEETRAARRAGEEYLLERALFRRLGTGEPAEERYLTLTYPTRWMYDVLRGLDHFRAAAVAGQEPDPRLGEAIEVLRAKQLPDGRWAMDWRPGGRVWFHLDDGPGEPSRWITLLALRVLAWWDRGQSPREAVGSA
jgi:hypothetical protein